MQNFTSEIVFQFMDYFSIFNKGNSIVINFVLYTKVYIVPIFFCGEEAMTQKQALMHT